MYTLHIFSFDGLVVLPSVIHDIVSLFSKAKK